MFMIKVDYPTPEEELEIMRMASGGPPEELKPVLTEEEIIRLQDTVRKIPVADHVLKYAERIVRVTRPGGDEQADFCKKWLSWGAGPRASLNLVIAAKARAMLNGNFAVSCADVANVAPAILRHRIIPNFAAQSEGVTQDDIVAKILESIPQDEQLA